MTVETIKARLEAEAFAAELERRMWAVLDGKPVTPALLRQATVDAVAQLMREREDQGRKRIGLFDNATFEHNDNRLDILIPQEDWLRWGLPDPRNLP